MKAYISNEYIQDAVSSLCNALDACDWKPDYFVGITRGGLVPAVLMSHQLNIQMHTLNISLRDFYNVELNAWMAEDASLGKRILIVDDINDTGATLAYIKNDWETAASADWNTIWHHNVRFAAIINNHTSKFDLDYYYKIIDRSNDVKWYVFPWEYTQDQQEN